MNKKRPFSLVENTEDVEEPASKIQKTDMTQKALTFKILATFKNRARASLMTLPHG